MTKISILNWDKKSVGELELSDEVFAKPLRKDILQQVVRWQLACRRQGTVATKTKGLVSGGGKKPFKQKGTGNARQGSIRSPLMPGGGTAFGPQPRDYSYSLPKKVKLLGLQTALSYLVANKKLIVVDSMNSEGKTKELSNRLEKFGISKALLIDNNENQAFKRASSNLKSFRYMSVDGLNVYDILKYDSAIVTKDSLSAIQARCGVKG